MSPEINGNPPSVTKRKKNREKKPQPTPTLNPLEFNMSHCSYFPTNPNNFHNISIPDISAYYSYLNYPNPSEPMSLPVYPINYPNYFPSNPNLNFLSATKQPIVPSVNGDNNEYLSLPVPNADQGDDISKRRYSDPGLPNDSDDSGSSIDSKIVEKLTHQVNVLKESNRKLTREVMEMRIELNMLKQQQSSRHFDREYEPGMLADIIREVRDAARVREDALLAKVKHMIEEKQLSMNHLHLVSEKNRNNDRISKLEEQLKNLSVNNSRSEDAEEPSPEDGATARQVLELEREALVLRRELQETRAKKEEADQKLLHIEPNFEMISWLDKKLSSILRRNDICTSDASEDGKTNSIDSISVTTTSSISQAVPRVTLSGPVTDL
ncbi:uncharacterized protein LOC103313188 isoform X1 [Tribolium castaneum]|uniref:uncharacterized protein LOC103313188 isoform X1 n=1 Tax=Tribolium castaneum TaxID=7070 RepID=UPI00046C06F0|nr:PREDICTED: uncharacterized protein LOC103313188 isoform X1 [Tribolium castaneum]|eukprot:XP_008193996.1 PREDICTED: uncharacterized protein LOC103313188 isoform X1 [Tribolium castaneum]